MQYCSNLTDLDLNNNSIINISYLENLLKLKNLIITNNNMTVDYDSEGIGTKNLKVVLSLLLNGCGVIYQTGNIVDVVTYSDTNLEAEIRTIINKPTGNILPHELASVTEFIARDKEIMNLYGLEYCTNLTNLNIDNNSISDISILSNLTNLKSLVIHNNSITNINVINNLTNLITLNLSNNSISNISVLSSLTNIRVLYLDGNLISDISVLNNLTILEWLDISNNGMVILDDSGQGTINLNVVYFHIGNGCNVGYMSGNIINDN